MQPDLGQRAANEHADVAQSLLSAAEQALSGADVDAELQIRLAQAHATLALAFETRAAAYDTRTAAYVAYLATLKSGARQDKDQHAPVVAKLVRDRLGFEGE
jgi:hypothetical protein